SSYHETEPVGGPPGQGRYLNAAAELQTRLEPPRLLEVLLEVEKKLGRVRTQKNDQPTIDLDLFLYGDVVSPGPEWILPHSLTHERLFVLEALAEIAPQAVYPRLEITVRELLEILHAEQDVEEAWQELQRITEQHTEIRSAKAQAQSKEET